MTHSGNHVSQVILCIYMACDLGPGNSGVFDALVCILLLSRVYICNFIVPHLFITNGSKCSWVSTVTIERCLSCTFYLIYAVSCIFVFIHNILVLFFLDFLLKNVFTTIVHIPVNDCLCLYTKDKKHAYRWVLILNCNI